MLERVAKTISRYNMLPHGSRVIAAVSGGADSVCLLHVLVELAPEMGLQLEVAHLNHQLRGTESDADEQFVKELAAKLNLRFHCAKADVTTMDGNLEQAARRARLEFFHSLNRGGRDGSKVPGRVATGHTRDDQAETVLLRLLRGSGLAGLAGIHPVTATGLVRPLLDVTRAEIVQYLRERGIAWREDSSNRDLQFSRNRVRHELLPQLTTQWNPRLTEALAHLADLSWEEERWWLSSESPLHAIQQACSAGGVESSGVDLVPGPIDSVRLAKPPAFIPALTGRGYNPTRKSGDAELNQAARDLGRVEQCGVELDVRALATLPRAVSRRVIRRAIASAKGNLRGIEFEHVERVVELARQLAKHDAGSGRLALPGLDVRRSFDWIRLASPVKAAHAVASALDPVALEIPGQYPCPDGKSVIRLEIVRPETEPVLTENASRVSGQPCANLKTAVLGLSRIPGGLQLRGWRPGDRYRPQGHMRVRKLKEMFSEARIPSWQRRYWPILMSGDSILWSRQFGVAADYAAEGRSGPILRISEVKSHGNESFDGYIAS